MELITLGIGGLLLLAIWHFALKKAILDDHRDQLFDLRDELRGVFLEKGWAMDSRLYRHLRDLINGYLRFTERYSFAEFNWIESELKSDPVLRAAMKEKFDEKFLTQDNDQQVYVRDLRARAVKVMMNYMIVSSGPLLLLAFLMIPFVVAFSIAVLFFNVIRRGGESIFSKAIEVRELAFTILQLATAILAKGLLRKDFVEEYSFKQA